MLLYSAHGPEAVLQDGEHMCVDITNPNPSDCSGLTLPLSVTLELEIQLSPQCPVEAESDPCDGPELAPLTPLSGLQDSPSE